MGLVRGKGATGCCGCSAFPPTVCTQLARHLADQPRPWPCLLGATPPPASLVCSHSSTFIGSFSTSWHTGHDSASASGRLGRCSTCSSSRLARGCRPAAAGEWKPGVWGAVAAAAAAAAAEGVGMAMVGYLGGRPRRLAGGGGCSCWVGGGEGAAAAGGGSGTAAAAAAAARGDGAVAGDGVLAPPLAVSGCPCGDPGRLPAGGVAAPFCLRF